MRILHICNQYSVRAAKLMHVLAPAHEQAIVCSSISQVWVDEALHYPVLSCSNLKALQFVSEHYDVVWVHSTLDSDQILHSVLQVVHHSKIVVDIHDYHMQIDAPVRFVVPTPGYLEFVPQAQVVPFKVPMDWVTCLEEQTRHRCLVSGVASSPNYRDYRPVYEHYNGDLDIYAANVSDLAMVLPVYQIMSYPTLLQRVSSYQVGYAGPSGPGVNIDKVVTHKYWEYRACGLEIDFGPWDQPKCMLEAQYESPWLELSCIEKVL